VNRIKEEHILFQVTYSTLQLPRLAKLCSHCYCEMKPRIPLH